MTAPSAKQGRTLSYSKCHYCRKDKKKCEPKDRVWPGQKCNRCLMKDLECSASVSLSQHLIGSPHALPRDDHGTHLSAMASSGKGLMLKTASSVEEGTHHSEPTPAPSDGSRSSTTPESRDGSSPSTADQDAGAVVQMRTAVLDDEEIQQPDHSDHDEWERVDRPLSMQASLKPGFSAEFMTNTDGTTPDKNPARSLKRSHCSSAEDKYSGGINDGAPAKRFQSGLSSEKTFACPFWKMNPLKHRTCLTLKLYHCSRVKQHLSRAHTPTFYCQRCLTILPDEEQYQEHLRRPSEDCVWKNDRECEFINHEQSKLLSRKSPRSLSEEGKWYQLWDVLFPTKPHPASPFVDADLSEELSYFNEFLQNEGVVIMSDLFTIESPLPVEQEPGMRLREVFHRGFSRIWQKWKSDRQSQYDHSTECEETAPGASPSAVSLVNHTSIAESSSVGDIIEPNSGDIYMRQLVIIKTKDGRDYVFEEGQIDTCNDAKYMILGKRLVKTLGLKEEPTLGCDELQGINGPILRPTSFVRVTFKMPWLGLDWVTVCAYVIDANVGFNLGNKAIMKFGLLNKLFELDQAVQEWVFLRRRGTRSTAGPMNPVLLERSKDYKREYAGKHQGEKTLAMEIATFREQWRSGIARQPSNSRPPGAIATNVQSTYAHSITTSITSDTAASTVFDEVSSSWASMRSRSDSTTSLESFEQDNESWEDTTLVPKTETFKREEPQMRTEYLKFWETDLSARLTSMVLDRVQYK